MTSAMFETEAKSSPSELDVSPSGRVANATILFPDYRDSNRNDSSELSEKCVIVSRLWWTISRIVVLLTLPTLSHTSSMT